MLNAKGRRELNRELACRLRWLSGIPTDIDVILKDMKLETSEKLIVKLFDRKRDERIR